MQTSRAELAQYFRRRVDGEVGLIIAGGIGVDSPASCGGGHDRTCAVPLLHGTEPLAALSRAMRARDWTAAEAVHRDLEWAAETMYPTGKNDDLFPDVQLTHERIRH